MPTPLPTSVADPRPPRAYNADALAALGIGQTDAGATRVAIGFVDYGFDLLHPALIDRHGGGSRFRCLWDQNSTPAAMTSLVDPRDVADWTSDRLDREVRAALASGSRRALDERYDPHASNCGRHGTVGGAHGTLMASIAAGNAVAGFVGAAPFADLIGVQLALLDHHWQEQDAAGTPTWTGWNPASNPIWNGWRSYDECPQIINAVRYIYDRACRLGVEALVINLSLGAWAGSHDGGSPVEAAIADLIATADAAFSAGRGPRVVVVAGAGNAGADDGHWTAALEPGRPARFDWMTQRLDPTQNKLEIWYRATPVPVAATVALPDAVPVAIAPGRTHPIEIDGRRVGIAEHTINRRRGLSCIRLLIHPPLLPRRLFEGGQEEAAVAVELASTAATCAHAWIERDDGAAERSWIVPSHPTASLCCLATAPGALVVGGYDHRLSPPEDAPAPLPLASLGPAPWSQGAAGRVPHACAPAHGIWGARSKTRGFSETTGTSAAVALASGGIARWLRIHGPAAVLPLPGGAWHPRFGHGPLDFDLDRRKGVAT